MKFTIRQKSCLLLVFSLLAAWHARGQTTGQAWSMALGEEQAGNYSHALSLYHRIRFFKPDTLLTDIYVHIGNCEQGIGQYYKAIDNYDNALISDFYGHRKQGILVLKLRAEVLARNFRYANNTLAQLYALHNDSANQEGHFYEGAIDFALGEYDHAKTNWLPLVLNDSNKAAKMIALFKENQKIDRLKPGVAIALSVLLPGAGQVYAGDLKEGVNSLLLTGAFLALGISTAFAYNLFNAVIAVGPWYLRYYSGGFLRAGQIVEAKRAERHQKIYRQILEMMQQ